MNELENRRLMLKLKNNIDMKMYKFLKYDLDLNYFVINWLAINPRYKNLEYIV